ncbi:hypothetical protein [Lentzea cavernae]|uniref:Serine/threonine protein kinase n=1 Tax=Lentzea cavernae TaxID=2020703 RepID=A0ABQ3MFR5_9PSEU|nr:hypothetical protein [Lentzea cavernae]GHH44261.1 hypothetical protein GCM10017774_43520 [Lentzea cavernae]
MEDAENTGVTRDDAAPPRVPLWGPVPASGTPGPAAPVYEYPAEQPWTEPPSQAVNTYMTPTEPRKPLQGKAVVVAVVVSFVVVAAVVVVSFVRGENQPSAGSDVVGAPVPVTSNRYDQARTTTTPPARYTTTRPSTSVSSSRATPTGYREVTGPNGVFVSIPQNWTVAAGSQPTNHQADDPATPGAVIRYGASTSESRPLYDAVAANEASVKTGYQRLKLTTVSSSTSAVEWEFLYTAEGVQRHAFARYWRRAGLDYIVYGASNVADWPQMQRVVDVLVSTAGPTA